MTAVEQLEPEKLEMLAYTLEGMTWKDMSEKMGVHINTIYKRKNSDDFQAALKEKHRECVRQAQNVFANKAAWAAQKIIDMVDDPETTRVQFQAATFVYEAGVGITIEEFEDRLIDIEESITREV